MALRDTLLHNASFIFEDNIFYQSGLERSRDFEKTYIKLREKEGRVYDDETLKNLSAIIKQDSLTNEWASRKESFKKLLYFLNQRKKTLSILELGCGNGWLSHNLITALNVEVCGMDVNETELLQGARVFKDVQKLSFVYGDIFSVNLEPQQFDVIILSSSIQYFPNVKRLLRTLLQLLTSTGEILILDSPFYLSLGKADAARKRSSDYFQTIGFQDMKAHYFHHTMEDLKYFSFKILYDSSSLVARVQRKLLKKVLPVFPIIRINNT